MSISAKISFLSIYLAVSLVIAVGCLIICYPWHPITVIGWILLFLLATPVTLIGQYIGELLTSDKISNKIDPSKSLVSSERIVYLLIVSIAFICLIALLGNIMEKGFGAFLEQHYSNKW